MGLGVLTKNGPGSGFVGESPTDLQYTGSFQSHAVELVPGKSFRVTIVRGDWDYPKEYIAALEKNIVGLRVDITRIEGRFKVSQEKGNKDRGGVVDGLEQMQTDRAREMAAFVKNGVVSP